MELTCPNCATQFSVPSGAIGSKGRKVKCSQCGHVWRQYPLAAGEAGPAADASRSGEAERSAAFGEPPPVGPVPLEMEPRGTRPAAEPVDEFPSFETDDLFDRSKADDDPLAGFDFGGGDEAEAGSSFDDLIGGGIGDGEEAHRDIDSLLSAEAEPIPEMFGGRRETNGRRGGGLKTVAKIFVFLLLVAAVLAGVGYVLRDEIVRAFPEAEPLYAAAGVPVSALGVGLRFENVASERIARDGVDTLVVRGFISNVSQRTRELPYLHLALYDPTDAVVQQMVAEPPRETLEPGSTVGFRIQMENPSAAARRFEVDWTEPPASGR